MDAGRLRLGLSMLGSWARASHEGRPGDGFSNTDHRIDVGWAQWRIDAGIALHPRFGIDLALPVRMTSISPSVRGPDGQGLQVDDTIHRRQTAFGLGDLQVGVRYGVVRDEDSRGWVADVQFGATLPTGKAQPSAFGTEDSSGRERPSLGSGTVNPVYGLSTTYNAGRWGMTAWANAQVPVVENRFGIRASRIISGSVGPFSSLGLIRWRFVGAPEIFVATPVRWNGQRAPNSDRIALMATAGAFFQPRPLLGVYAMLKVPVYTRTTGGTLVWPVIAVLGVNYTFALTKESSHHHD